MTRRLVAQNPIYVQYWMIIDAQCLKTVATAHRVALCPETRRDIWRCAADSRVDQCRFYGRLDMKPLEKNRVRRSRSAAAALAAGALVASMSLTAIAAPLVAAAPVDPHDYLQYVNPFIGTQDEGNTYPGVAVPFGMVQVSPDTGHTTGYAFNHERIQGFSQVHISGAGCPIGGMISVLPTNGYPASTDRGNSGFSMRFRHGAMEVNDGFEYAYPGYYQVALETAGDQKAISAELTATERTSVQKYTFKAGIDPTVTINPGQAMSQVTSSKVKVNQAEGIVEAVTTVRGFCRDTNPFTVYSVTKFNQPITEFRTWLGNTLSTSATQDSTQRTGAALKFAAGTPIEAQTAISYVDLDGAYANLEAEKESFDSALAKAENQWVDWLARIRVEGGDPDFYTPFYSAWYRTALGPNIASDVDGRYRGWDTQIHDTAEETDAPGFIYYQNYSLWDTYRSQQQTLGLFEPMRSKDMMRSLVLQGEQYWAPRWSYGPVETNIMTGDPVTPFLVTGYKQGLIDDNLAERAYAMLKDNVDVGSDITDLPNTGLVVDQDRAPNANGRLGNPDYLVKGYIPYFPSWEHKLPGDQDPMHAGSASIEYALADAAMAELANDLGYDEDAARYAARGQNFRVSFNTDVEAFQPRVPSGVFYPLDQPAAVRGFHEGTAIQYEWLVPQDPRGLVDLLGGKERVIERLDHFFAYDKLLEDPEGTARNVWVTGAYDYYNQDRYNPNNEPNLAAPYSYSLVGQPWKTADVVRAALTLFTNGPTGVTGNDDLGQMSSWAALNSIGLYPTTPGSDTWAITSPVFDRVVVTIPDPVTGTSHTGVIRADGLSEENRYVQSVKVNGVDTDRAWITGADLRVPDLLIDYTVGSEPSDWATSDDAMPPSLFAGEVPREVQVPDTEVVYAGNDFAQVTLMVTGLGTVSGDVTLSGDALVKPSTVEWTAEPNGGTQQIVVSVPIELANSVPVPYGEIDVVASVEGATRTEMSSNTVGFSRVADNILSSKLNKKTIGKSHEANSGITMDSSGFFHLQEALGSVGLVQGRTLKVPGKDITYSMIPADPLRFEDKDSVNNFAITIPVGDSLKDATQLAIIGSAPHGPRTANMTIEYGNGRTSNTSLVFTDWCSTPGSLETVVAAPSFRGGPNRSVQDLNCNVTASDIYLVPQGRDGIVKISIAADERLAIYAIASDGSQPLLQVAADSGVEIAADGKPVPGQKLTASTVRWALPAGVQASDGLSIASARTSYQWYRDGVAILGANERTYMLTASDAGRTISVAATGWLPGTLSAESRSSVKIATVIDLDKVELTPATGEFTGKVHAPDVRVVDANGAVVSEDAYTISWSGDRIKVGTYTVTVTAKEGAGYQGEVEADFTITPSAVVPDFDRISGANRYETSLELLKSAVPGKPIFLATGSGFADALSAAPAAASVGGRVVLTQKAKMSPELLSRLNELGPSQIYVIGGENAVSKAVFNQAKAVAPSKRISGTSRYDTSLKIYKEFFSNGVDTAFIATGRAYPDALVASAAAGALGSPVILVDGKKTAVPADVAALLPKIKHVAVAGGKGAVSLGIESSLKAKMGADNVERLSGTNRFETATAIGVWLDLRSDTTLVGEVYVATGYAFPDALSAAAPAGDPSARLVLAKQACMPGKAVDAIKSYVHLQKIHLVGGQKALSDNVGRLTRCP